MPTVKALQKKLVKNIDIKNAQAEAEAQAKTQAQVGGRKKKRN